MGAVRELFEQFLKKAPGPGAADKVDPPPLKTDEPDIGQGQSILDQPPAEPAPIVNNSKDGPIKRNKARRAIADKLRPEGGTTVPGEGIESTPIEQFGPGQRFQPELPPEEMNTREAGTPVAEAVAAGKAAGAIEPDTVFTNFANIEAPDEIKSFMFQVSEEFKDEFNTYSRGVQKLDDIEARAIAGMTNSSPDDIFRLQAGDPEGFTQGAFTLVKMATEIQELAAKGAEHLSQSELVKLRLMMENYAVAAMHMKGLQTETARTMSAMRIVKRSVADGTADMGEIMDQLGGEAFSRRAADHIRMLNDPAAIGSYVNKARKVGVADMLWEAYYGSLLSSPQTHIINGLTSTAAYALTMPQQVGSYVVGLARDGARQAFGFEPADRASWQEATAYMLDADTLQYAGRRAWRAFKSGQPDDATAKLEGFARQPAITVENLRQLKPIEAVNKHLPLLDAGSHLQVGLDYLFDFSVRGPTRVMVTMDEFNKGLAYQSFIKREAVRYAQENGVDGARLAETLKAFEQAPDRFVPGVEAAASRHAQELTFQQPLGPLGRPLQRALNTDLAPKDAGDPLNLVGRMAQTVLRLHVPFMKTPVNLIKWASTNAAPFNLVGFARELRKGGREADMAVSQMTIATAFAYGTWNLVVAGHATGSGPSDRRLNSMWRATGAQPYSFSIPKGSPLGKMAGLEKDLSVQYKRADPFTQWLGAMADWKDLHQWSTPEEQATAAGIFATVMYNNIGNKTFMMSIGRLQDALSRMEDGDGGKSMTQWMEQLVSSPLVPSGARWYGNTFIEGGNLSKDRRSEQAQLAGVPGPRAEAGLIDETTAGLMQSFERMKNGVAARAPSYGENLPDNLTFWGDKRPFANNGPVFNMFPFYTKELSFDLDAIRKLGMDPSGFTGHSFADAGQQLQFIRAANVEGEFLRLGWAPGFHPREIKAIPLTPAEQHDWVKMTNAAPSSGTFINFDGRPLVDYAGKTLRQSIRELMTTPEYFEATDFLEQPQGKQEMITRVVNDYRWRNDADSHIGLGGAALQFFNSHPEFQMRLLRGQIFTKSQSQSLSGGLVK